MIFWKASPKHEISFSLVKSSEDILLKLLISRFDIFLGLWLGHVQHHWLYSIAVSGQSGVGVGGEN